jgi:hypothetical protein
MPLAIIRAAVLVGLVIPAKGLRLVGARTVVSGLRKSWGRDHRCKRHCSDQKFHVFVSWVLNSKRRRFRLIARRLTRATCIHKYNLSMHNFLNDTAGHVACHRRSRFGMINA